MGFYRFSSPRQQEASGESGQNNGGLVRLQGIGAEAGALARTQWGKKIPAQVLAGLRGKGLVRKKPLADLIFASFYQEKEEETLLLAETIIRALAYLNK